MKLGMTSLTLRNHTVADVIQCAKNANLSGIEWGVSDEHLPLCDVARAEEIKELSREAGLEIFSLGSYCDMDDREICDRTLDTAVILGAPIIRIWAGTKYSRDCSDEYKKMIVENTIYLAEKAEKHNIVIGFEYHASTLAENPDAAIWLVKAVNRNNVGLYWQPDYNLSPEENRLDRDRVLPFCIGNLHIQNYSEECSYQPLSEIEDVLHLYYDDLKHEDYRLMIEFVKDGKVESLNADAETLKKVISLSV